MLQVKENNYLFQEYETSLDGKIESESMDLSIQKTKTGYRIFSLNAIKEISLFDLSGRVLKIGDKVNDHLFNINFQFKHQMPLFVKILMEGNHMFMRI